MRTSIIGRALALACATCLLAACAEVPTSTAPIDRELFYDSVWRDVDLHYPYFAANGVNWDSVGQLHRERAMNAASDREFLAELGALLAELHDPHVSISAPGLGLPIRYVAPFDTTPTYFDPRLTTARYVIAADTAVSGNLVFGWLTRDIEYLRVASFSDAGWSSEVDRAIRKLRPSGLVIDLRDNMGGDRATALSVASIFADRARVFGYLRYRNGPSHDALTPFEIERISPRGPRRFTGPVYLLTNRRALSSTEQFVLAMRTLPNVTVIGDTTGGASGGPVTRSLPNGWSYQFSRWIEYTAAGVIYQGTGIAPDITIATTANDRTRGIDPVLERAIALCSAEIGARDGEPRGSAGTPR